MLQINLLKSSSSFIPSFLAGCYVYNLHYLGLTCCLFFSGITLTKLVGVIVLRFAKSEVFVVRTPQTSILSFLLIGI
jgi:hypothetical protein